MVLAPSSDRERSLVRWEGVLQRGQGGDYRCLPQPCKAQERSCVFSCVPEHSCDQSVFFSVLAEVEEISKGNVLA